MKWLVKKLKTNLFVVVFLLVFTPVSALNLYELLEKERLPSSFDTASVEIVETLSSGLIKIETLLFEPFVWQEVQWQNHLLVIRPPSVQSKVAVVFITGDYGHSDEALAAFRLLALQNRAYVAVLFDIPNQPLFGGRREDWLISYTFSKFLETGDPQWPALVPMVRSTVVSMNLLEEYAAKNGDVLDGFILTGGSKRGWTSWLTAAMDKRVKGIVPIAYDNLNLSKQMPHQIDFWGGYSRSIREYVEGGILNDLEDPDKRRLLELVDPYTYRESLDIPKLVIVGTNDPYWPINASQFYVNDLPGYTSMVYAPNAGHGTELYRVTQSLQGMLSHLNKDLSLPSILLSTREVENGLEINASVDVGDAELVELRLFVARSEIRDFRRSFFGYTLIDKEEDVFLEKSSFLALYVEGLFKLDGKELLISTPANVF
jgi:PhoPQ-activated pathogenicity-related protein